jgi:exosortase
LTTADAQQSAFASQSDTGAVIGPVGMLKIAVLAALLLIAYWSVVNRLAWVWNNNGDWSHGWLVPAFSLYFLYSHAPELRRARVSTNYAGLLVLTLSLVFYLYYLIVDPKGYFQQISMVSTIFGATWFLAGTEVIKIVWFSILFLCFAIPLPENQYVAMTMPLRELASQVSARVISLNGDINTSVGGVVIDWMRFSTGEKGQLNVEQACSGMRLMMALVTLGVAMAYLGDRPAWQRIVMCIFCVPIAVVCNMIRVTVTGFLHIYGSEFAHGAAHTVLGLLMVPLALGQFWLIGYVLSHLFVEDEGPSPQTSAA